MVRSLALDIPYEELDRLVDRLEQRGGQGEAGRGVSLFVRVNGTALPMRNAHVEELDRLIARVHREGNPVKVKWPASTPAGGAAAQVVPVSHTAAAIERLPPVVRAR